MAERPVEEGGDDATAAVAAAAVAFVDAVAVVDLAVRGKGVGAACLFGARRFRGIRLQRSTSRDDAARVKDPDRIVAVVSRRAAQVARLWRRRWWRILWPLMKAKN